jgi:hypothetical protein
LAPLFHKHLHQNNTIVIFTCLQSAKVILSELNGVSEAKIMRHVAPLALLFMVLAQVLGLMWTIAGVWPDVYSQ